MVLKTFAERLLSSKMRYYDAYQLTGLRSPVSLVNYAYAIFQEPIILSARQMNTLSAAIQVVPFF